MRGGQENSKLRRVRAGAKELPWQRDTVGKSLSLRATENEPGNTVTKETFKKQTMNQLWSKSSN